MAPLYKRGANIIDSAQHSTDPEGGTFLMRMEFQLDGTAEQRTALEEAFAQKVARPFAMDWRLAYGSDRKRIALLVRSYPAAEGLLRP